MALAGDRTYAHSFGRRGRTAAFFDRLGMTEGGGSVLFVGGG